jgi:hypothetical protein
MKLLGNKLYLLFFFLLFLFSKDLSYATTPGTNTGAAGSSGPQVGINQTVCGSGIPVLTLVLIFILMILVGCIICAINIFMGNKHDKNSEQPQNDLPPIPVTGGEARVQQPSGISQMTKLSPGSNPIGRGTNNSICLDDPKVSTRHADLYVSESRYTVTDLNSRNGTFVNGEKITQKDVYQGDQIQMGDSTITV